MAANFARNFISIAATNHVGLTQVFGPMTSRNVPRKINASILCVAVAISLGTVASGIPASHARNALLATGWVVWLVFVATYPYAVLSSGVVTGTQPVGVSRRPFTPARFWTGFVATTLFWVAILAAISLYSVMAWYRGA